MPNYPDGNVHIGFINVGMGDCTVIKGPRGELAIIDCGSTNFGGTNIDQIRTDIEDLIGGTIQNIDFILFTHSDADHYNQIGPLVGSTPIDIIYHTDGAGEFTDNGFRKWYFGRGSFKGKGCNCTNGLKELFLNEPTDPSPRLLANWSHNGVTCRIELLAANVSAYDVEQDDNASFSKAYEKNTLSAVLCVTAGTQKLLIAGDATNHTEKFLLATAADLSAGLIRVGHHGSNSSSSQEFVDAVDPGYSIFSASAHNTHSLPKSSVVARWLTKSTDRPENPHEIYHYNDLTANRTQEEITENMFMTGTSGSLTFTFPQR
ncbi:MAG: MBL fold metallo-hydrolase [Bacteroidota bacterium]